MASYIGARPEGLVLTGDIADDAVTSAKIDSTSTGMALADLTVDTSTLVVDATNNRIGIGTTTPVTPIEIETTNKLGATFTGTTNGEGLTVTQSDYSSGNYISLVEAPFDDSGVANPNVRIGALFTSSGSTLAFGTSNNYSNGITNTAMTIDPSGNVGIGTTPSYGKLHIFDDNSDINMDSNGSGQLHIDGNGYTFGIALNANGAQMYTNSASRDIIFGVNETEVARVTTSGLTMAAAKGIDFSAAEGSGASSSLLDDYEEGTWTATLEGFVSDPTTPVTVTGNYTKIGRLVYVDANFNNVNTTGASGRVEITGFPYNSVVTSSTGQVMSHSMINIATNTVNLSPYWVDGTTLTFWETQGGATAWQQADHSAGAGRYLFFSLTYQTS